MLKSEVGKRLITSMSQGFSNTFLLYTACKLEIFDAIDRSGSDIETISKLTKVNKDLLYRIVRPLIVYGFIEKIDSKYILTDIGKLLTDKEEGSLKGYVLYCGSICAKSWSVMAEAAKSNKSPYSLAIGGELFEGNRNSSKDYSNFNAMMNFVSKSMNIEEFLKKQKDLDRVKEIVDIGGGTGAVILQFLKYYRNARGRILDLDFVKEKALANISANNLLDRTEFVVGNFFEPYKLDSDVFILSRVLHDWKDDDALSILKNIRNSMSVDSFLYVIELVVPEDFKRENLEIFMNDLQIWAVCGGKERSLSQYNELFEKAGLILIGSEKIETGESVLKLRCDLDIEEGEI